MATHGGLWTDSMVTTGTSVARSFKILNGDATDMLQGDLMKMNDLGYVEPSTAASDVAIVGVFIGCEYTNASGQRVWSNKYTETIARDDTMAFVNVNPFQLYKIAIANSDVDTTLDQNAIGGSYDIEYNTGDTTIGLSGMNLDSGVAEAATAQLRVVAMTNDDGIDYLTQAVASTYSHAIVQIDPDTSFWLSVGVS
tara:strand:- start:291 stop:878 length:588 start_codon:yes stop_codon:yes gene_type:complete